MLEFMRKKRNSTLLLIVFAVIIIVFLFFGVGPPGNVDDGRSTFATVNGVKISAAVYNEAYKRELDNLRYMYGGKLDPATLEKLNLRQTVRDRLINRAVMLKFAKDEGVKIGKQDVQDEILKNPVFQKAGVYDVDKYMNILSANGIKPEDYETNVKEDLTIRKLRERVTGDVKVTDEEVRALYEKQNRQVSFKYVELSPSDFKGAITVTDAEAAAYLDVSGEAFMVPDRLKAVYAYVDIAAASRSVKTTEEELKDYYAKHIDDYRMPEKFKARHILFSVKRDKFGNVDAKDKAAKKAKMDGIVERLKKGEDFSALAKEFSDDTMSASSGGDLGFFELAQMTAPFANAVSALKIGEISPVVETDYGFHVIKLDEVKSSDIKSFESQRADISSKVKRAKAVEKAGKLADELGGVMRGESSVAKIKAEASKRGAVIIETGFFVDGDASVELFKHRALADAVFMAEKGAVTAVVEDGGRLYVAKVLDRIDRHVPPLKDIMAAVKDKARGERAVKAASDKAAEVVNALNGGMGIDAAAKQLGLKVKKTAYTSYAKGVIPELRLSGVRDEAIFDLSKENPHYKEPLESAGAFYVLAYGDSRAADAAGFESKKADVADRLLTKKKIDTLDKWVEEAKGRSKIKINENYM